MPSRSLSSFSRTIVATAPRVGVRNANTSSRLNAAAAAIAPTSNLTDGHGKGFTETLTGAGACPDPMALPSMVLQGHMKGSHAPVVCIQALLLPGGMSQHPSLCTATEVPSPMYQFTLLAC